MRRVVLLAIPGHRRTTLFEDALARAQWPAPVVFPWLSALHTPERLHHTLRPHDLLRIESPGGCFETERALLSLGARSPLATFTRDQSLALPNIPGALYAPAQWHRGLCAALQTLRAVLSEHPTVRTTHALDSIPTLFDKRACHSLLAQSSVPVPPAAYDLATPDALFAWMARTQRTRVFVKLAYGSSAVGILALDAGRSPPVAFTTMQPAGALIRNTLRVQRVEGLAAITPLLQFVLSEGAIVEAWLPKAGLGPHPCDLRVLVIDKRARHIVLRAGRAPMTNLHLGSQRGDLSAFLRTVPPDSWSAALRSCERAAEQFPHNLHAGVDLLLETDRSRHAILEVNAFGDLLPGALSLHECPYTAQLTALA